MSVYASGEEPQAGDRVLCVDNTCPGFAECGHEYTVKEVVAKSDPLCVIICNDFSLYARRFRLIRRADSAGKWIVGPPPSDCFNAFVINRTYRDSQPHIHERKYGEWSDEITHHIPIEIPPPPEPIALPRRFRATATDVAGTPVAGCVLPNGEYHYSDGKSVSGRCREDTAAYYIGRIEFID